MESHSPLSFSEQVTYLRGLLAEAGLAPQPDPEDMLPSTWSSQVRAEIESAPPFISPAAREEMSLRTQIASSGRSGPVLEPEERAALRGFTLLMERDPEGSWLRRAIPEELDIMSLRHCVLGLSFGSYSEGQETLWSGEYAAGFWDVAVLSYEHGFTNGIGPEHPKYDHERLNAAWVSLLTAARAERGITA